jgi:hypothetical protein
MVGWLLEMAIARVLARLPLNPAEYDGEDD